MSLFDPSKSVSYVIVWSFKFGFGIVCSSKLCRHDSETHLIKYQKLPPILRPLTSLVHLHSVILWDERFEAIFASFSDDDLLFRAAHQAHKTLVSVDNVIYPFRKCVNIRVFIICPLTQATVDPLLVDLVWVARSDLEMHDVWITAGFHHWAKFKVIGQTTEVFPVDRTRRCDDILADSWEDCINCTRILNISESFLLDWVSHRSLSKYSSLHRTKLVSFFVNSELVWNSKMLTSNFRIHKQLKFSSPHWERLDTMNLSSLSWFTKRIRYDLNELWSLKMSWSLMTFRNCHCPCSQLGKSAFDSTFTSGAFLILNICWFLLTGENPFLLESELQSLFIFRVISEFSWFSYW